MRASNRRELLKGLGAIGIAMAVPRPSHAVDSSIEARTTAGKVRGIRSDGICRFLGVPYAGAVSGAEARFLAPPPLTAWRGVRDATKLGAPSIQPYNAERMGPGSYDNMPLPSEDCLFLNIWTPAVDHQRRPVMFYNHGGGYVTGSGGSLLQDGANLARNNDVVVVESNHRLGLLGYLYLQDVLGDRYSGNAGLLDIEAALRFTHHNIAEFGGDPDNVMVFGESGGGWKTSCIYAMPSVKDLFNKASIESGPGIVMNSREAARETTRAVLSALGIEPADARKILEVPAEQLLKVQKSVPGLGPVVDGVILPADPFSPKAPGFSSKKPLLAGSCHDEATIAFLSDPTGASMDESEMRKRVAAVIGESRCDAAIELYRRTRSGASASDLWVAIATAYRFRNGEITIAERKVEQHAAPVFMYVLDYRSPQEVPGTHYPVGAMHASDIAMKFDNAAVHLPNGVIGRDQSPERYQTARNMSRLWASFARFGKPTVAGLPAWPPYTLARRATMIINAVCRVVDDPDREEREFWDT